MTEESDMPRQIARRVFMRIIVSVIVGVILGALAYAGNAHAATATPSAATVSNIGIPPSTLGSCEFPDSETGGWNLRDIQADGTRFFDPAPVRVRNARLGEPCFDSEGYTDFPLAVPVRLSDIPVAMVDEDDDGFDDPGPTDDPADCTNVHTSAPTPTLAEVQSVGAICIGITLAWLSPTGSNGGHPVFSEGQSSEVTVIPEDADDILVNFSGFTSLASGQTQGGNMRLWCRNTSGVIQEDESVSVSLTNATPPTSVHLDCSATTDVAVYVMWDYWTTGGTSAGRNLRMLDYYGTGTFPVQGQASYLGWYGGTQAATFQFGAWDGAWPDGFGVDSPSMVYCASTYTGPVTLSMEFESAIGSPGNSAEPPVIEEDGTVSSWDIWQLKYPTDVSSGGIYKSNCPYLVKIEMWVCSYTGHPLAGVANNFGCFLAEWTAERWRDHTPYQDPENPQVAICDLYPDLPGCYEVLNPPVIDGTDFDTVCAGAPTFTAPGWDAFFNWVPDLVNFMGSWIGHYAECFFVPANGFDRLGWVDSAWRGGAGGEIATAATSAFEGLELDGYCGTLTSVVVLSESEPIDTCAWEWGTDVRMLLYWGVLVLGGFSAVMFVIKTVQGVAGGQMPSPDSEEK